MRGYTGESLVHRFPVPVRTDNPGYDPAPVPGAVYHEPMPANIPELTFEDGLGMSVRLVDEGEWPEIHAYTTITDQEVAVLAGRDDLPPAVIEFHVEPGPATAESSGSYGCQAPAGEVTVRGWTVSGGGGQTVSRARDGGSNTATTP